jgi:hypothetical protein
VTTAKYANTDLAATAWLGSLLGLTPAMVATTLPEDNTTWAASGFVTVRTVGGTPEMYVPMREPVVSVDCYATAGAGNQAPYAQANNLAETIVAACQNLASFGAVLHGPAGYPDMRVLQAHALQEPRRLFGDRSFYARYQFDLALYWIALP